MRLSQQRRPSRWSHVGTPARLASLFVLVTPIPLAVLGWLGRWSLQQERSLEAQRRKTSIVVSPLAGGADRTVIENVPGALRRLSWSADSRHIFFTSSNNEIWRVSAEGGPAVDTGIRAELTKLIGVNPDGRRIGLSGGAAEVEVWLWENLLPLR